SGPAECAARASSTGGARPCTYLSSRIASERSDMSRLSLPGARNSQRIINKGLENLPLLGAPGRPICETKEGFARHCSHPKDNPFRDDRRAARPPELPAPLAKPLIEHESFGGCLTLR